MEKNGDVSLLVSVPVCSFRKGYAREYLETEELPPPSTIYGFLLSLVGEEDRDKYIGTHLAYAVINQPEKSVIIRTTWRMKIKSLPTGVGNNRSPDYQEILTGLQLGIWIRSGDLADKIIIAGKNPKIIDRYGGLCLGESRDLINDVNWNPLWAERKGYWVINDPKGDLPLPIWVDHVGSKNTVFGQFRLYQQQLELPPENDVRWIVIVNEKIL